MMVHDIQKNVTRVIHFQGTAPKTLREETLPNVLQLKVIKKSGGGWGGGEQQFISFYLIRCHFPSFIQAGLQVGVPGMLRGLHYAHSLYGR